MSNPVYPVATPMRGSGAEPWSGGQVRCFAPEAKSSLAFESPAAEQNVPDSGYVEVHTVTAGDHVRVLGVTFSSDLSLEKHVSKTCSASFYWNFVVSESH